MPSEEITQDFESQQKLHRSAILRVYNYYRIFISFLFLYLFVDTNLNDFVGSVNPELFQTTIILYIVINILIGLATLLLRVEYFTMTAPTFAIVTFDIISLTLLMSASGGVDSGLGNFMIFSLAFGGGLILGRVSTVLPAIAFILTIYGEFYLFFLDQNSTQSFFQAGILGIVFFVSNILFQTLSRQLRSRDTEVHTLEQINRLIIERMPTGVVVISKNNQPRLLNNAAEHLLENPGHESPRKELPQQLIDRVVVWNKQPIDQSQQFSVHSSGPDLIASFSRLQTPQPDSDTLVFLEDSTEVQRQAQQLKLASVGRLSASIAHEIRNPLGAISHAAQLLGESDSLETGDKRLCEIIQNHCVRMNNVIENVLQLSRRKTAEPRNIRLGVWLVEFIEEFSAGIPDAPQIDIRLADEEKLIAADPMHLSQVLGNLCQNGIRYSLKKIGQPKLEIVGDVDAQNRPYLEVIDYGPGVPESDVANLFEPFFTTETTGTGLGLYLSKELCQSNNARLTYSRTATGGSAFRITFLSEPLI